MNSNETAAGAAEFDPVAVARKIADLVGKADKAKKRQLKHATEAGVLLLNVKENHPEHFEPICESVGLSRSRRGELLMVASGKRTHEENNKRTRDRVNRHRAKKKANALPKPDPGSCPLQADVTDDAEASAERRKAEYDALYPDPVEEERPGPLQGLVTDDQGEAGAEEEEAEPVEPDALAEFMAAADRWLPVMSDAELSDAIDYAMTFWRPGRARRAA
jgi:hypothetical protein